MEKIRSFLWKLLCSFWTFINGAWSIKAQGDHWTVYRNGDVKFFYFDLRLVERATRVRLSDGLERLMKSIGLTDNGHVDDDPTIAIESLMVEPDIATALWVAGELTLDHLRSAIADQESIRIPHFRFGTHTVTLYLASDVFPDSERVPDSHTEERHLIRSAPGALAILRMEALA